MKTSQSLRTLLLAASLALAGQACKVEEGTSRTQTDFEYRGAIRVYMGAASDAQRTEYRPIIAASSLADAVGVCTLRTVKKAAECKPGATGYFATEKIATAGGKNYFRTKDLLVAQNNLVLVFQATSNAGAVVDTRIVIVRDKKVSNPSSDGDYLTKGSGGRTGAYDGTFGTNGRFKAVVPTDNSATKSHGLLVFLHGSTASSYAEFAGANASVAAANGLMSVSVLAPNGQGWNEGDQTAAAKYLDELLTGTLFKQYNIDTRKIFFHGQSSGAGFLSSHFVASYGQKFGGGALMLCGASKPATQVVTTDRMKKTFRLYYDLTTNDGIWTDQLAPAIADYRSAGLTVESTSESGNQKPGGHCQFDQQAIVGEVIPRMIQANGAAGGTTAGSADATGNGGGAASGDTNDDVTFRIKKGTGNGAWNTAATEVRLKVGKKFTIFNDDDVVHQWHTNGSPCPHGNPIQPGQAESCTPTTMFTAGPLYDHITNGSFFVRAD